MSEAHEDIKAMSFEDAMEALDAVVRKLESGQAGLEESINIYDRGAALKAHCESKLKNAEARIRKIVAADGEAPQAEPFDTARDSAK